MSPYKTKSPIFGAGAPFWNGTILLWDLIAAVTGLPGRFYWALVERFFLLPYLLVCG